MSEKIDVLLATYNGEKYLREQIDSILNQTYKNIRLVISDDCSKDGTCKILEEYEKKDERVEIHLQKENLGYIKNFEYLLRQVKNNLYMLSDQDDVWLPEKIEKSADVLKREKADLVYADLEVVDQNLTTVYPSFGDFMLLNRKIKKMSNPGKSTQTVWVTEKGNWKSNYLYNCVTGCTLLSKKKFIKDILPLPCNSKYMVHDYWMAVVVSSKGRLAYMTEKYIKYRQHGNNQIGTDKISHKFKKLDQVRDLFLDVKLGVFGSYVENNNRFPKEVQKLNTEAYEYFKMLTKKKNFNFKGWTTFHKLYKYETFIYYLENFCILNLPLIGRGLFNIRYVCLKLLKKRK